MLRSACLTASGESSRRFGSNQVEHAGLERARVRREAQGDQVVGDRQRQGRILEHVQAGALAGGRGDQRGELREARQRGIARRGGDHRRGLVVASRAPRDEYGDQRQERDHGEQPPPAGRGDHEPHRITKAVTA